ncbi:MAG: protein kinase, partial [Planctomycetes bacterium]|nr:protein kinase [Planctomycetota bacterium]
TVIGPYKLLEQIGEGGFGVVFMAEQEQPVRRRVALKVIKPGMDTREVIARFEAERQALALMDHPNIARVLDAGATSEGSRRKADGSQEAQEAPVSSLPTAVRLPPSDSRPYFVMELVKGITITDYCDRYNLTLRERLELFATVCQAVQHAHTKGVIHRDIKPSNVLVTLHDGRTVPKVIDFGVSKAINQRLTERTLFTQFAQMIGTPLYMSPEQAELSGLDIDTRSDVYSLGVLLYELLTGTTPFEKQRLHEAAFDEIRRIIREEEPPRPSTRLSTLSRVGSAHHGAAAGASGPKSGGHSPPYGPTSLASIAAHRRTEPKKLSQLMRGELDWIVMKALDKDRTRRYETANSFAADVLRYLNDEPVQACPPSAAYRFRKFARRNRGALTTAAIVLAALVSGTAISTCQALRATRAEGLAQTSLVAERNERERAEQEKRNADRRLYISDMRQAQRAWEDRRVGRLLALLDGQRPERTGGIDLRGFEWHYWHRLCHKARLTVQGSTSAIYCLAISPDGKYLATAGGDAEDPPKPPDGEIQIRDAASARVLFTLRGHGLAVWCLGFSPDGRRLVSVGRRATIAGESEGEVKIWDLATRRESLALPEIDRSIPCAVFSSDGKYVALGANVVINQEAIKLYDAASGELVRTFTGPTKAVRALAFHPAGTLLASAGDDAVVRLWDLSSGTEKAVLKGHTREVWRIVFSPDGRRLASGSTDQTVKIWNVEGIARGDGDTPEPFTLRGHGFGVLGLAFSPDGQRLVSASSDQTATLWDAVAGRELATFKGHTNSVFSAVFAADGRSVISAGRDGTIRFWDDTSGGDARIITAPAWLTSRIALSPDGQRLASGGVDAMVRLWDPATGQELLQFRNPWPQGVYGLTFSPDGQRLATCLGEHQKSGGVSIRDAATGNELLAFKGHRDNIHRLAFSPDGKRLATAGYDGQVILWDANSGRELLVVEGHSDQVTSLSFSPDGRRIATAGADRMVRIWDAADGRQLLSLGNDRSPLTYTIAFSPDGKRLAGGRQRGEGIVWDAVSGRELLVLEGHTSSIAGITFSPDGRRLATAGLDRTVRLWDARSGQETLTLRGHTGDVRSVVFGPDGRYLASRDETTIRIWDAAPLPEEPEQTGNRP